MIKVTKLNGENYYINPHQIEYVEANPDTTILLLSGRKLVIKENIDELIKLIKNYRREIAYHLSEE